MQNVVRFKIFEKFPELACGIVGRPLGIKSGFDENYQIKYEKNLKTIIDFFNASNIRIMFQVHGINIHECGLTDRKEIIEKTDGLITQAGNLFLVVKTADCVPIFFYEPMIKMVGVVHAGWKGTLNEIAGKMVTNIVRHGGRAENISVAIGPYIHDCCYNVSQDRFLDLGKICAFQMIKLGVPASQIEISQICTKCNNDRFYSFRAGDRNVNNVGIIGMN